ncbi:hypothetical protein [Sulfurimonas sp.]
MHKKIIGVVLIFIILIIGNVYIVNSYIELDSEYNKLKKECQHGSYYPLYNSVNEMNVYFNKPDFLPLMINAEAGIYFKLIGENNDTILTQLNEKKYACRSWTKNTKKQYEESFLYYSEVNEFNTTYDVLLKGLEITDSICLSDKN